MLPLTRPGGVQAWKTSSRSPSRSHVHGTRGFEWLYVLSGRMRLVLGQQGAVSAGDAIVSPSATRTLLSHFGSSEATDRHQRAAQQLATPTDREREVGTAVGAGASTAGIAASST